MKKIGTTSSGTVIVEMSVAQFDALALGKETHSDFDMDELRRLTPVQNGTAALNIAEVCRRTIEEA